MRAVQTDPIIGQISSLVVLGALTMTVGLQGPGWVVGVSCALATNVALARAFARSGARRGGPADRVTLARAALVAGVAALTADAFRQPAHVKTLVVLSVVALVLDAVDGWVARRTSTVSMLGARFDMEVDAFLILVLSVYVSRTTGGWVVAIGAARYALVAAGWMMPWMRAPLPPRYWCKVVAATQGVVLVVAAANVLPRTWVVAAVAVSLALLMESFGREVGDLWRLHRRVEPARALAKAPRVRGLGELVPGRTTELGMSE